MQKRAVRYSLLDSLRGIALFNMIAYHLIYDLVYIFGISIDWYQGTGRYIWQQSICCTFIFLSGICWCLGRNPIKRGLITSACGLVITFITALFMPKEIVLFGILTCLGLCTLLMALVNPVIRRIPAWAGLLGSGLLFLITRNINSGFLGFGQFNLLALPALFYKIRLLTPVGFPFAGFYSSDYFPLFPWFFLFSCGYFTWRLICKKSSITAFLTRPIPFFHLVGQQSLPIYLLHQPLIMLGLTLFLR
ncbi:MAG: heparan-alpha-glucosaminide N-acetyltransferase domain-containing protein [Oscillospiraceae bacterium]|nr:heparan-alpha-glucosaminide N-acetyltransferase domain-containing protein [Oscillospiraceae bacterium]